jgi:L,D-transpeptidase ErfK/SrfK
MRNNKLKTPFLMLAGLVGAIVLAAGAQADDASRARSIEALRTQAAAHEREAAALEEENRGLRNALAARDEGALYVVVDIENNRLALRRRDRVVHTAVCGTGSRQFIKEETGRNWYFETPTGSFTVRGKERNPVWIRPDWSFVEENMPIPPPDDRERFMRGVLGKYALLLGNGYKIHGTKYTRLLGSRFTHGCVSLGDDDLELLYQAAPVGTKVYIY